MSGIKPHVILDWDGTLWNSYRPPFGLYPEAKECIERISRIASLSLLTAGDDSRQTLKIVGSGLSDYFDRIMIVPDYPHKEKALAEFVPADKGIVSKDFRPEDVIVVGDRIDLEIPFGNALDFTTVRIRRSRNHRCRHYLLEPTSEEQTADKEISHLSELVEFIENRNTVCK